MLALLFLFLAVAWGFLQSPVETMHFFGSIKQTFAWQEYVPGLAPKVDEGCSMALCGQISAVPGGGVFKYVGHAADLKHV